MDPREPAKKSSRCLWVQNLSGPLTTTGYVESIGERVDFALKAGKIMSDPRHNPSDLRVEIRTSDGHQAETTFDLARLK
jgi:hypothetical protein